MNVDASLRAGIRWLDDLAAGRVPQSIPTVQQLRQYSAALERDLAVRAQLAAEGPPTFTHLGTVKPMMEPELSDADVAGEARMLTPMDMTPEAFLRGGKPLEYYCVLVRDRILSLSQRLAAGTLKNHDNTVERCAAAVNEFDKHPVAAEIARAVRRLKIVRDEETA